MVVSPRSVNFLNICKVGDLKGVEKRLANEDISLRELRDNEGNSALALACTQGHLDIAKALVNFGFDLEAYNDVRFFCIIYNDTSGYINCYSLLQQGWTALHLAMMYLQGLPNQHFSFKTFSIIIIK